MNYTNMREIYTSLTICIERNLIKSFDLIADAFVKEKVPGQKLMIRPVILLVK